MRLTGDGFDYTVRDHRDLLVYRHTQHLNGDPVQGSVRKTQSGLSHFSVLLSTPTSRITTFVGKPDSLLNGQVFVLIICGFRTESLFVETSHHVLLYFVHNTFYLI